jgi:hypothetical protein
MLEARRHRKLRNDAVAANHPSPPRVMLSERGAESLHELRKDK